MGKYKKSYNNNKFEISGLRWNEKLESGPRWNEKLKLPDGSYSVSDIQYYSDYIIKKQETVTDNPPIRIYVNKI